MKVRAEGIIFDLDNTLLRSNIDFARMKTETHAYLAARGVLPSGMNLEAHTTATVIEAAMNTNRMTEQWIREMWDIPRRLELLGMENAELEPGVPEALARLRGNRRLVVVTNNSVEAAVRALRDNGIYEAFDCVVGREMMRTLKPAPDGFLYVLERFRDIAAGKWISVGDSWADGKASAAAGIPFVAYRADEPSMRRMGVAPIGHIADIRELTAE
ncbi:HAD family phosphatase [Paenibacillus sp.]|uniref:HAD family hydrolase n=1 Tax=Paenibacillus sp. TaxID=58172 RepID=UPI002D57B1E3|nr:HAD family phosphatase [Paenibacillus sp.]HZG87766.1 HAD family phosphatase [Paenibacillus sp.]